MLYLISHDLTIPDVASPPLFAALERAGATRVMDGQWMLASDDQAAAIYDQFARYVDPTDRLLVTEITQNSAMPRLFADFPTLSSLFDRARRGPG
jgi:hypothetical protein